VPASGEEKPQTGAPHTFVACGAFSCVRIRPPGPALGRPWDPARMSTRMWPHETLVTLHGGPLDGEQLLFDPGDLPADQAEWGGYYMAPPEMSPPDPAEGVVLRAVYEPEPGEDPATWVFSGWVPW
jgi:hypothetical protein